MKNIYKFRSETFFFWTLFSSWQRLWTSWLIRYVSLEQTTSWTRRDTWALRIFCSRKACFPTNILRILASSRSRDSPSKTHFSIDWPTNHWPTLTTSPKSLAPLRHKKFTTVSRLLPDDRRSTADGRIREFSTNDAKRPRTGLFAFPFVAEHDVADGSQNHRRRIGPHHRSRHVPHVRVRNSRWSFVRLSTSRPCKLSDVSKLQTERTDVISRLLGLQFFVRDVPDVQSTGGKFPFSGRGRN